ncbi:hypothetical protein E4T66_02075 [Sinimarinibacterium sp. CAU 1509]|uniref:HNH endonuclease n=1 Tax=Sinimarinibacterium sp. CAU 1509 TaxID=2562283 RepID=UPI0010AD476C|nr:hypothetical protein [Sinimarinibacterium sp. CAU 1509]TJY65031.1 hypothetical protein E4T66_02075 [Sinimarinibacterium sp. CAU 1509]
MKKEIKELQPRRQLKYCPMCGVTLPKTFDHYMPAARFPEYAVMALNLIPCCSQCNSIKDDDWLSTSGERQFLHLYFDCIPEEQYLFVQLLSSADMRGVGASFELRRPSGFRRNKWSLLTSHYKRLKLLERFSEEGNEEIAEVLAGCKAHLQAGGGSASLLLQNLANDRATVYGDSHWRTVLMRALSTYSRLDQLIPLI